MPTPSGMVAILTRSDGVVMATAADFDPKSPGYDTVEDAQRSRARHAVARVFVLEFCGPDIADVTVGRDADRLVENLCRQKGYRLTIIAASGDAA